MNNRYSYIVAVRAVPLPSGTPNCFVAVAVPPAPLFFRTRCRDGYTTGPDFQKSADGSRPDFCGWLIPGSPIPPHPRTPTNATRRGMGRGRL